MNDRPNVRQHAAFRRARNEIRRDVAQGIVPKTVTSFAQLHDYVDANEYGGFTDETGDWAFDSPEDGWTEETVAEMNHVQNALDAWLKSRPFEWTTGVVEIDTLGPWLAVWQDDVRWNGWLANPKFDAYTAVKILDMVNADPYEFTDDGKNYYGYDYHFEDDGTLVVDSNQYRIEDPENAEAERIEPDEDGLYSVGGWGWVWSEAAGITRQDIEDPEKVDPVVMAFLPEGEE